MTRDDVHVVGGGGGVYAGRCRARTLSRLRPVSWRHVATVVFSAGCYDPPPVCTDKPMTTDVCLKATDLLRYLAPQLGHHAIGGNATVGEVSALHPGKRISLGISVRTGSSAFTPRTVDSTSGSSPATSNYDADRHATLGKVDVAVGVIPRWKGIVGVDLLVNAMTLPRGNRGSIEVTERPVITSGGGLRVGIAPDSLGRRPVVSLTVMQVDQERYAFRSATTNGSLHVRDMWIQSSSWQLAAGKVWNRYGVNGGLGRYNMSADGEVSGEVSSGILSESSGDVPAHFEASGSTGFVEGTMRTRRLKFVMGLSHIR